MRRLMDSDRVRAAVEEAVSVSVQGIRLSGIEGAVKQKVIVTPEQLRLLAVQLEQQGHGEIKVSAEVELFLRISNNDALSTIESTRFRVSVNADGDDLRAVATSEKDWAKAWERGLEPIKDTVLEGMRRDVWKLDATLSEDDYTFQAAMILFASVLVGPYVDRIVQFLGYARGLVQVIAARLQEAKIWEGDEVRCESWFDPQKETVTFMLDLMVAEGTFIRTWSEEEKRYGYSSPTSRQFPGLRSD